MGWIITMYSTSTGMDCRYVTGRTVLPAFTLNNFRISKKICEGISLKCVAPFGFLSNIYLYAVSYFTQQLRVAPGWRNHNAHCRVHKSPLLIQLLINFNSLHTLAPFLFNISYNIILPRVHVWLPSRFSCLEFLIQILYAFLVSSLHHQSPNLSCFYNHANVSAEMHPP